MKENLSLVINTDYFMAAEIQAQKYIVTDFPMLQW